MSGPENAPSMNKQESRKAFRGEPLSDDGVKLATLSRGPNRELRIRWREFKGHCFLDLREWSVNPKNSQWWPEKGKGITIKARELQGVAAAITMAIELNERKMDKASDRTGLSLDPRLKAFIDRAVVPALLERFLRAQRSEPVDESTQAVLPSSHASA
jgi:hypothetical protein